MNRREAILEGVKQATQLHRVLGIEQAITQTGGRVDVFDSAVQQGSIVLFKKLTGILGAYFNEGGAAGIIVTNQRRLSVQRFTGAHELGHFFMRHAPTIDGDEILSGNQDNLALVELEANSFASEFLAPRWLLVYHAKKQEWDSSSMGDPIAVYQLALRLGMSYEATCRSLSIHKIVPKTTVQSLLSYQPKDIKRKILPPSFEPLNWFGDVWLLTEKDRDTKIEGHSEDFFVLKLREKSGAGYLWDTQSLESEGFRIVADERSITENGPAIGSDTLHEITVCEPFQIAGRFNLVHRRPWESRTAPLSELSLNYDLNGKENGLPRAQRRSFELQSW